MSPIHPRFAIIDWLRATAIVLMIIYHFCYDLAEFGLISHAIFNHTLVTIIGRSSLCLFMFCVGYSLALAHGSGINWHSFFKRWIKIAMAAALVSGVTFFSHPQYWIYFGILHCIAVTSLLGLLFLQIPLVALITGTAMLTAYWVWGAYLPWIHLDRPSLDYIPVFPWIGPALIGVGLHRFRLHEMISPPPSTPVSWLSRHSLEIYLVHQPILMGMVWVFAKLQA